MAGYNRGIAFVIRMNFLISNDDGYFAPGPPRWRRPCHAWATSPWWRWSATAAARPIADAGSSADGTSGGEWFFSVNGTPTDCVHLAITGLMDSPPDMVFSGINHGPNMGDDTLYSGTVAAATEGYLPGIPSVAMSLAGKPGEHFASACLVAEQLVRRWQEAPWAQGRCC